MLDLESPLQCENIFSDIPYAKKDNLNDVRRTEKDAFSTGNDFVEKVLDNDREKVLENGRNSSSVCSMVYSGRDELDSEYFQVRCLVL